MSDIIIQQCVKIPGGDAGGGPWEIIDDTTVSSPVASVEHVFDPALYRTIICTAIFTQDTSAEPTIYPDISIGEASETFIDTADGNHTVPNTNPYDFAFKYTVDIWQEGAQKGIFVVQDGSIRGDSSEDLNARNWHVRDIGSSAKVIYGIANEAFDAFVNIGSGRFITYGLRKAA